MPWRMPSPRLSVPKTAHIWAEALRQDNLTRSDLTLVRVHRPRMRQAMNYRKLLVTVFVVGLLGADSAAQIQGPRLKLSETVWDFGTRDQGEKDRKIVYLENTGDAVLVIKKVTTSCGCVEPVLESGTQIGPGHREPLVLNLDTNKGEGEIAKVITVESSDPRQPKAMISIRGTILPIWSLDVHTLNFGEVKNGDHVTKTVRMKVRKGFDVKLKDVQFMPSDKIACTRRPFKAKNGDYGWDLEISLVGKMETGGFEGIVLVSTDFEARPQRGFRVTADIVSSTRVTPSRLSFGILKPGQKKTITVRVQKMLGGGLRIVDTVAKDSHVVCETTEVDPGKVYSVAVTLTAGAASGDIRGQIEIGLDEPGWRLVKLPYYAKVVKP